MSETLKENNEPVITSNEKSESTGRPIVIHKPRKKTPIQRHLIEIIACSIFIVVALTIGLCLLYTFDEEENSREAELLYEPQIKTVDPVINLLSQFGRIKMHGQLGAVPTTFEMDFHNEEGCRYHSTSPLSKYVLKVRHANINPDKSFHVVLTDYLEGRIAVGRFDGIVSNDGSVFSGEYTSRNGKVREFSFEK